LSGTGQLTAGQPHTSTGLPPFPTARRTLLTHPRHARPACPLTFACHCWSRSATTITPRHQDDQGAGCAKPAAGAAGV